MRTVARILDHRGCVPVVGLLIMILFGIIVAAPRDMAAPPRQSQWSVDYAPSTAGAAAGGRTATPGTIVAQLAGGAAGPADGGDATAAESMGEGEGAATSDLPADYIPGTSPDAGLAAVLRESEQRNRGVHSTAGSGAAALAANPNVRFTRQSQIEDLVKGLVDPRVVDLLTWIAGRSQVTITSLRTDHSTCVAGSNPCRVSAHHLGRAFDVGAVNGQICTGIPDAECGRLYEGIVSQLRGTPFQPAQVIYGYDPWPAEGWNFEMGNHHDHIHIGY